MLRPSTLLTLAEVDAADRQRCLDEVVRDVLGKFVGRKVSPRSSPPPRVSCARRSGGASTRETTSSRMVWSWIAWRSMMPGGCRSSSVELVVSDRH